MSDRICSNTLIACDRKVHARGLCNRCYQRVLQGIPIDTPPQRGKGTPLMKSVEIDWTTGCWNWTGGVDRHGYGRIQRQGKRISAHRAAWLWAFPGTTIPDGVVVCHKCDNPPCVNPAHLFLGTQADNLADMSAKGRSARGEKSATAKLTEDDVRAIRADTRAQREIAADYGIHEVTVSNIKRRKRWKHVE